MFKEWVANNKEESEKNMINEDNLLFALITILGSTFYSIGGILTLKIKNKGNENVTTSTTIWSLIFLLPLSLLLHFLY